MKIFFLLSVLSVAIVCYADELSIDAVESYLADASGRIVTELQTDAANFNQIWSAFQRAKNITEQVSMFPNMLDIFADSYKVFAQEFATLAKCYPKIKANKNIPNEITIPDAYLQLFFSTLTKVGGVLTNIVDTLDDLKKSYYQLVDDIDLYPFNNENGVAVVPLATASAIKNDIGKIAQLNELISSDLRDAVTQAEALNRDQVFDPQDLDPTAILMIEGFEDIGNYLSMITDVIGQYVQTFDTEFPAEFDNTNQDYINLPELIANSNALFQSTQSVYASVCDVFTVLHKLVPIITWLYNAIG